MKQMCRNCQSENITTVQRGELAPFFLKRVYGIYLNSLGEVLSLKVNSLQRKTISMFGNLMLRILGKFKIGRKILRFRLGLKVNIRGCKDCSFVGPDFNYEYAILSNLYKDYRSKSYDAERINFEPFYETIKDLVGKSKEEIAVRMNNLDTLINKYVDFNQINHVMDWGGGEGKFIPTNLQNKNVWILDVSNEPLVNSKYHRVDQVPSNIKFDFVQVCHVLEHVASPFDFMSHVMTHVDVGGYIYIELPQDRDDEDIQGLIHGDLDKTHVIHEHLNLFNSQSLYALAKALGLQVVSVEAKIVDYGWIKGKVISGLFIKQ
jgi:hypothetical protein